jgi:hypothetical protein
MAKKTRLELTWIGKDQRPRLEPRILIEEPGLSHHAATRREGDIFDDMLAGATITEEARAAAGRLMEGAG